MVVRYENRNEEQNEATAVREIDNGRVRMELLLHYAVQREVLTTGKGPLSGRLSMGGECEIVTAQRRVVCTWARKWRRTDMCREEKGLAEKRAYHVARDALELG
jgi:hypothetical protein